jgi:hypothetical protein
VQGYLSVGEEINIGVTVVASYDNILLALHRDLQKAGVDYAVVGGIALGAYNYLRNTDDVDILVSRASFPHLQALASRGYIYDPDTDAKTLYMLLEKGRVQIDIQVEGEVRGLALPDPVKVRKRLAGVWFADLPTLIAMKLAAGRIKDLQDVQQLMLENALGRDLARLLPGEVQEKYLTLLDQTLAAAVADAPKPGPDDQP